MADTSKNQGFDEILRRIGPDATATFDNSASNPTEHASSEATNAATAVVETMRIWKRKMTMLPRRKRMMKRTKRRMSKMRPACEMVSLTRFVRQRG